MIVITTLIPTVSSGILFNEECVEQGYPPIRAEIGNLYLVYDIKYKKSLKELRKIARSTCLP